MKNEKVKRWRRWRVFSRKGQIDDGASEKTI
jgi:hypothetical protein